MTINSLAKVKENPLNDVVRTLTFTMSNAQLLTLNGTPVTVINSLNNNTTIIVERVYATKSPGTAYTIGSNAGIDFRYTNGSGNLVTNTLPTTGFLDQAGLSEATCTALGTVLTIPNASIVAIAKTANVSGAGPSVQFKILYRIVPQALLGTA